MDIAQKVTVPSKYMESITLYYTHVTNHAITGDGKFLLAAIKTGYLAVFPVRKILKDIYHLNDNIGGDTTVVRPNLKLRPLSLIPVKNSLSLYLDQQLNSTHNNLYNFIAGGEGKLTGHAWSLSSQLEDLWTIKLPSINTQAYAVLLSKDRVFSGCSDNTVYVHDKETQSEVAKLSAHEDYIHSLKLAGDNIPLLYSASEDGSVRTWDLRTPNQPVSIILPFKKASLERPHLGKWIGALDISPNNEWLVCGGGPKLSMWHISSQKCVHVIDYPSVTHVAQFLPTDPSAIISAGHGNQVSIWRKTTDSSITCNIESSIENIYSIAHHQYEDLDYNLSSFSGDSFKLELCRNNKYIDTELYVS